MAKKKQIVSSADRPTSVKNKTVALVLCVFLGVLGVHRYYVGKIGTGLLWTFTAGLFGVGWIIDLVSLIGGGFYDADGRVLRFRKKDEELAAEAASVKYLAADPAEIWARWRSCSQDYPQQRRMARASDGMLTPSVFSAETRVATFVGHDGGQYQTTLIACSCPDFEERGLPCKHMYWLAQQLGLDDCVAAEDFAE